MKACTEAIQTNLKSKLPATEDEAMDSSTKLKKKSKEINKKEEWDGNGIHDLIFEQNHDVEHKF